MHTDGLPDRSHDITITEGTLAKIVRYEVRTDEVSDILPRPTIVFSAIEVKELLASSARLDENVLDIADTSITYWSFAVPAAPGIPDPFDSEFPANEFRPLADEFFADVSKDGRNDSGWFQNPIIISHSNWASNANCTCGEIFE